VDDDPTNPTRRPWAKSRDKLSEWVRGLGVTDPGISPNHAWRHTFKRIGARAGIERRIRFAMCGHISTDEGDRYETPSVEDMAVEGRKPNLFRNTTAIYPGCGRVVMDLQFRVKLQDCNQIWWPSGTASESEWDRRRPTRRRGGAFSAEVHPLVSRWALTAR
jgi:hypothetical protein